MERSSAYITSLETTYATAITKIYDIMKREELFAKYDDIDYYMQRNLEHDISAIRFHKLRMHKYTLHKAFIYRIWKM